MPPHAQRSWARQVHSDRTLRRRRASRLYLVPRMTIHSVDLTRATTFVRRRRRMPLVVRSMETSRAGQQLRGTRSMERVRVSCP